MGTGSVTEGVTSAWPFISSDQGKRGAVLANLNWLYMCNMKTKKSNVNLK